MFALNVHLTVKDAADVPRIRELLAECRRRSLQEPGCIHYEVCHSRSEPQLFVLVERWASEQAWQDHRAGEAVQQVYLPQVIPLVDRVPHICDLIE